MAIEKNDVKPTHHLLLDERLTEEVLRFRVRYSFLSNLVYPSAGRIAFFYRTTVDADLDWASYWLGTIAQKPTQ